MTARYASYEDLAEIVRHKFSNPTDTLRELYCRMTYNILCGNTDDHAKNHASHWYGEELTLSGAYDICPQGRTRGEATQAMLIDGNNKLSQIQACLSTSHNFRLKKTEAKELYQAQRKVIEEKWDEVCEEAELSEIDKSYLWRRQFLNPFAFEGLD